MSLVDTDTDTSFSRLPFKIIGQICNVRSTPSVTIVCASLAKPIVISMRLKNSTDYPPYKEISTLILTYSHLDLQIC